MSLSLPPELAWLAEREVLAALELAWVIGVSVWILLERRPPVSTLAWILALAALPIIGAAVYLALGPRRLRRKKLRAALLRRSRPRYLAAWREAEARELTGEGQLARLAVALDAPPPETARSVTLLADGDAFLASLEEAIAGARHHVHAEFYIFEAGRAGARIRDALAAAARRGVRVRLLVDGVGAAGLRRRYLRALVDAGGEVAWFNPVLLARLRGGSGNFRTHRKIVVCDGRVGFTGGMNVSDDQSSAASGTSAWRDTSVRIEGGAVRGLQLTFAENWAFATDTGLSPEEDPAAYFPPLPPGPLDVQIVPSGPDQEVPVLSALYATAFALARERVWVTTPYFVPDEPVFAAMIAAALRGVDVRLLVPRRTDSRLVDAAARTYFDALADAGAKIFLHGPPMLHAKTCLVDRDFAMVGTGNLDNRSLRLNFEVTAILYDDEPVEALAALFERDLAAAEPRRGRERDAPFATRLAGSFARLLAPVL